MFLFLLEKYLGVKLVVLAQTVKNLPAMRETQVWFQVRGNLLEKEIATHSNILAGKFHGKRSLAGYRPPGHKDLDMTEWLTLVMVSVCLTLCETDELFSQAVKPLHAYVSCVCVPVASHAVSVVMFWLFPWMCSWISLWLPWWLMLNIFFQVLFCPTMSV